MISQKIRTSLLVVGLIVISGLGYGLYILYYNYDRLAHEFHRMQAANIELERHISVQPATVVERIVSKGQPWREVQDRVKDTVVQVFSQISEIDLFQPYITPRQGTSLGSGFFISEDGYIVTNAHVVDQASGVWIQIPSLGKRIIDVDIIGVSPDMDLALLKVRDESLELIREVSGAVPYLKLGDSDLIKRSDEILAIGYPLGMESLKSTTGIISGRERHMIQMSAPINPGNSGGPSLNSKGEVVGINTAIIKEAQNVGYLIPVNDLKTILPDLYKHKLLRKPFLGVIYINGTDSLAEFLGNPLPGGCYVADIIKNSTLQRAGVQEGDMIYEINGYPVDQYGEMAVSWSEDRISIMDYVIRLTEGQDVNIVLYRKGKRKEFTITFDRSELPAIRRIYPGLEEIDYEVFAGMVVMPLTMNHIQLLINSAPGLARYADIENQLDPILVVTHIFPNSQLHRTRTLSLGATLVEVNGKGVRTLEDLRGVLKQSSKDKYLTVKACDNVSRLSASIFTALPFDQVLEEESRLSLMYKYPISATIKVLIQARLNTKGKRLPSFGITA